jgi:hypothetical protein
VQTGTKLRIHKAHDKPRIQHHTDHQRRHEPAPTCTDGFYMGRTN